MSSQSGCASDEISHRKYAAFAHSLRPKRKSFPLSKWAVPDPLFNRGRAPEFVCISSEHYE
jgi:hypothetical protein